jgi:hypothetical protein
LAKTSKYSFHKPVAPRSRIHALFLGKGLQRIEGDRLEVRPLGSGLQADAQTELGQAMRRQCLDEAFLLMAVFPTDRVPL